MNEKNYLQRILSAMAMSIRTLKIWKTSTKIEQGKDNAYLMLYHRTSNGRRHENIKMTPVISNDPSEYYGKQITTSKKPVTLLTRNYATRADLPAQYN